MNIFSICYVLAILSAQINSQATGHQVVRVKATTTQQLDVLIDFQMKGKYDFWSDPSITDGTEIMVSSAEITAFKDLLEKNGMSYTQLIADVETFVKSERTSNSIARSKQKGNIDWTAYYDYDDIKDWLNGLPALYPKLATVQSIGNSYEGRDTRLIKISNAESKTKKVACFMDGCFHAREWIACATVTYFINDLLSKPNEYKDILSFMDFYILPVVIYNKGHRGRGTFRDMFNMHANPDGYSFTMANASNIDNRMWRKTRSPSPAGHVCPDPNQRGKEIGVDLNRNFDQNWGAGGASDEPCSEVYKGHKAFSEIEGRNIRNFILNTTVNWQLYISLHCKGQWILIPWGGSKERAENYAEMEALAIKSGKALAAVHGTNYVIGQTSDIIRKVVAGGSADWAKSTLFKWSYTFELRPNASNSAKSLYYGFFLPVNQIIPTGQETVAAFKVMFRSLKTAEPSTSISNLAHVNRYLMALTCFHIIWAKYFL